MRVTLVHNPGAGRQGSGEGRQIVQLLEREGYRVSYLSSKDDGWKKGLAEPADLIVVAGGDGTVGKVARRVAGRGVPIAPLPSGTANNISRSLGLVQRSFDDLVRGWRDARSVKLDVGVAEGPWGQRYFVEGLGLGLFAGLLGRSKSEKKGTPKFKRREDKIAYGLRKLAERVVECAPVELQATLDGKDISGAYVMLEAVNIPFVGPGLFLAPDSKPGDGELDIVLVGEAERERLRTYLEHWQDNKERLAVLPSHKGKRLSFEWTGFELHIDDKLWPKRGKAPQAPARIEVRLEGHAVEFMVPPERPA